MNLNERISAALRDGRLYAGGLFIVDVSPEGGTDLEDERQRMYLTSDVESPRLTRLLESQDRAVIASDILGVADDGSSWVLSYQSGPMTHRVVVPLFGAQTARLIERAAKGDAFLVFTCSEEDEIQSVVEAHLQVPESDLQLLRQHWRAELRPAAADRLLQTIDSLLSGRGVTKPTGAACSWDAVTLIVPADVGRQFSKLWSELTHRPHAPPSS